MILTPTYHVLEMYNVHQDATLIPLHISGVDYVFKGEKLPAISASASKDSTANIHISLVNIDPGKSQKVTLNIDGETFKNVSGRILTCAKVQDFNSFDNPEKIKPQIYKDFKQAGNKLTITLPPISVVVLTIK